MLLKLKLFITSLINLGIFPLLAMFLYDLGVFYAKFSDLIWLIVFVEIIFATMLLMSIVYADKSIKKIDNPEIKINSSKSSILLEKNLNS
ncbi:MAG: hypothetical protein ACTSVV_10365 [Promethearchaeota archaeon]